MPIYGCKADVGDLIQLFQFFHDTFANVVGFDLFALSGPVFFQLIQELCDLFFGDRAFFARFPDAGFQFLAIVGFAGVVFFDHNEVACFDSFKGGKAKIALFAFAATADFS